MKTVIYGAGSIGCYIGAILSKQNLDVLLLGRPRLQKTILDHQGIGISDYEGRSERVADVPFSTDPAVLAAADIILVTLKCTAMHAAAEELQQFCKPGVLVVCLQNGVGAEAPVLRVLKQGKVVLGIVPFNVVQDDTAHFHRATEGKLHFPDVPELRPLQQAWQAYGLDCELVQDMAAIIWGKLLLNLNNAVNALSDMPLKTELEQRGYRRVLAVCQEELLSACAKRDITLAKLTAVKPALLPTVLRLPDFLFRLVAQRMLAIDPQARSSMWEDIQQGRTTEVEFLNGAVVALAKAAGLAAPANAMIVDLIHQLENNQIKGGIAADELQQKISTLLA